ncbi:hypothetical protein PSACC_03048 [Paramicrosporidium saccamoebae]|uniref:Glucosidase 2 subunit beta n=1 Tax=Paramicrosporidium saccamoebae TaxID=1246581 RepID=A0A2H9THA0_9FUNG|nr:hypothetical protein PSACC_03048 [Paramicrosporidium saccamoebae]
MYPGPCNTVVSNCQDAAWRPSRWYFTVQHNRLDETKYSRLLQCPEPDQPRMLTETQLNDNYCDCPLSGYDEPGTSACSVGEFWCANVGHVGKFVKKTVVDDGHCDCCDGSDEPTGHCPNTCALEALSHETRRHNYDRMLATALGERRKLEKEAQRQQEATETRLAHLKTLLTYERELLKQADTMKTEGSDVYDTRELQERVSALEEMLLDPVELNEKFRNYCEKYAVGGDEEYEVTVENPIAEKEKSQLGLNGLGNFIDRLRKTATTTITKYLQSTATAIPTEPYSVVDATRQRIREYEQEEIRLNVRQNVIFKTTALMGLYGRCFSNTVGKHRYEHCPFHNVTSHVDGHTLVLGKWSGWRNDAMEYVGGTHCWQGPLRSSTIKLLCGPLNRIVSVSERAICEYTIKFETPAVCAKGGEGGEGDENGEGDEEQDDKERDNEEREEL